MDKALVVSAIQKLEETADILYKGSFDTGVASTQVVIPILAEIASSIEQGSDQYDVMNNALSAMLEEMQGDDATALADVINYELIEFLKQLA